MGSVPSTLEVAPEGERTALLDIAAAAERLNVPHSFVRRLVLERRISYLKVGKYVRFEPADLDAWLDECRVEALRQG